MPGRAGRECSSQFRQEQYRASQAAVRRRGCGSPGGAGQLACISPSHGGPGSEDRPRDEPRCRARRPWIRPSRRAWRRPTSAASRSRPSRRLPVPGSLVRVRPRPLRLRAGATSLTVARRVDRHGVPAARHEAARQREGVGISLVVTCGPWPMSTAAVALRAAAGAPQQSWHPLVIARRLESALEDAAVILHHA